MLVRRITSGRLRKATARSGMSLLEVLASLAIFIFSAYALTQMVDNASDAATRARRLAKAQLLAETKMDEIVAGILPVSSNSGPIEEEIEGWMYQVSVTPESWSSVQDPNTGSNITGLNSVIVTVSFSLTGAAPIEYSLSRIVLDPQLRQPAPIPVPPASSSSSSGSGSSGSGSGQGGGR